MKFSKHFEEYSIVVRPYLTKELCIYALSHYSYKERQEDGRVRYWAFIEKYNKYLRVVVDNDGETVLTAHFDRVAEKKRGL